MELPAALRPPPPHISSAQIISSLLITAYITRCGGGVWPVAAYWYPGAALGSGLPLGAYWAGCCEKGVCKRV